MGLEKVNGIVTRYANYRESDRILTLLTRERGLISAGARGCRKPKSLLLSSAELFVYGEFILYESKGKYSVDSCEVIESFYPLREDIDKLSAASYMLALINAGSSESERADWALSAIYHALSFLSYTDIDPLDAALCFALKYVDGLGLRPSVTSCAVCGCDLRAEKRIGFNAALGGAVCTGCGVSSTDISALSLEAMRRMLLLSDEDMKKVVLPEKARHELKTAINEYVQCALERRFNIPDVF